MGPVGIWRSLYLDPVTTVAVASLSAEIVIDRDTRSQWSATEAWPPHFPLHDADEFVVTTRVSVLCGSAAVKSVNVQAELPELAVKGDIVAVDCDANSLQNATDNILLTLRVKAGKVVPWYPVGYGQQMLYTLVVYASDEEGNVVSNATRRIGLRQAKLVRGDLPDKENGTSFVFQVRLVHFWMGSRGLVMSVR